MKVENTLDRLVLLYERFRGRLPTSQAAKAVVALMLVAALAGWLAGLGPFDIIKTISFVAVIGLIMVSVVRAIVTSRQLRAAQEEIAQLAVMNERLRIARDLHDLLGHNLSLITLKSELARRLVTTAPERAAVEISDIENTARTTLQEVREAVASYRQPTLAGELQGAQEILAAAGIAYLYEEGEGGAAAQIPPLPPAVEATLSATVREGVTNVIRHSHARQCTIRTMRDSHSAGVEVVDDGMVIASSSMPGQTDGASTDQPGQGAIVKGSGLSGLAERVAALGGRCQAGARKEGGFRLTVWVPLGMSTVEVRSDRSE